METAARWIGFAAGIGLLGIGMIGLPALAFGLRRPFPLRGGERLISEAFDVVADRLSPERAARWLVFRGPAAALGTVLLLASILVAGLTLVLLPWEDPTPLTALRASGAAFFGLGLVPGAAVPAALAVVGTATGMLFLAAAVAFVVWIGRAVDRRQRFVDLVAGRGGSPPWGPEILAGLGAGPEEGSLRRFFGRGSERVTALGPSSWQGLLGEFRSRDPGVDTIVALLAMMDAAAIEIAVHPGRDHTEARDALDAGRTALEGITARFGIAAPPVRTAMLTEDAFADGLSRLLEAGVVDRTCPVDAWERFARLRRTYAPAAVGAARRLASPPAPWSGERG